MGKIFLVVPDAPLEETAQLKASRKLSGGIRLGVLDNSKPNADKLAGRAQAIWATRRERLAEADARRRACESADGRLGAHAAQILPRSGRRGGRRAGPR